MPAPRHAGSPGRPPTDRKTAHPTQSHPHPPGPALEADLRLSRGWGRLRSNRQPDPWRFSLSGRKSARRFELWVVLASKNSRRLKNSQILIAAAGKVHDDEALARHRWGPLDNLGQRVRRLQRRYDSLHSRQHAGGFQRFLVAHMRVLNPTLSVEFSMLGPNRRIIE